MSSVRKMLQQAKCSIQLYSIFENIVFLVASKQTNRGSINAIEAIRSHLSVSMVLKTVNLGTAHLITKKGLVHKISNISIIFPAE